MKIWLKKKKKDILTLHLKAELLKVTQWFNEMDVKYNKFWDLKQLHKKRTTLPSRFSFYV